MIFEAEVSKKKIDKETAYMYLVCIGPKLGHNISFILSRLFIELALNLTANKDNFKTAWTSCKFASVKDDNNYKI